MSDEIGSRLAVGGFKREYLAEEEARALLEQFGDGLIASVDGVVRDGKEATVYRCRAHPDLGVAWLAAKVFRSRKFRAFGNQWDYLRGHTIRDRRMARAMRGRSRVGVSGLHREWLDREWQTLCDLWAAGARVPQPFGASDDAILMALVGDDAGCPAPQLQTAQVPDEEVPGLLEEVVRQIGIGLECERVHGDLSAYNLLYDASRPVEERLVVIDFPQAVDPRTAPDARVLLERDVFNCGRWFRRRGLDVDAGEIADRLWREYLMT